MKGEGKRNRGGVVANARMSVIPKPSGAIEVWSYRHSPSVVVISPEDAVAFVEAVRALPGKQGAR